ncbi:molybdopterin-synthase adenylyltransferase MoeB [Coraliomargarita parva]|uniref:molybdopterin-synthase adenylyltransferase MoeB n=1 Tax=Coraliomargarita parva TaxID=3014050 RepID=UPI0022B3A183|nr:molybdopterin-synthase adenylyltransferase MoeB [Coraliomargarita parva]
MELSPSEILRYQRHLSLPGFGETAQLKLKSASVLVVGAGGLGCPALQYLAAAGVGTLGIVDDDRVSRSNLQRQILFADADVGLPKAEVAAARIKAMNPDIEAVPQVLRLSEANAMELVQAYDLVLDGSDNFPTRYLVNDACVLAGKPLVYGALYTFQGQVSVFNHEGGPTYRCLFPEPPNPEDAPNCSEIGVLGVLPGLVGTIQATEAIKVLTGIGQPLSGKLLIFDALKMEQTVVRFQRVPEQAEVHTLKAIEYANICTPDVPEPLISASELAARLQSGGLQLIDVREGWERDLCQIGPSVHLPLAEVLDGLADPAVAGLDPSQPTCVYCKGGVRSMKALSVLQERYGFREILSLDGGILAWAESADPSMARY